jgi:hypothetical protein
LLCTFFSIIVINFIICWINFKNVLILHLNTVFYQTISGLCFKIKILLRNIQKSLDICFPSSPEWVMKDTQIQHLNHPLILCFTISWTKIKIQYQPIHTVVSINYIFSFFKNCAGWGYIVAFTKVLTIYQIYHNWIHPLHNSPLSPSPPIPGIVSTVIIFCTL